MTAPVQFDSTDTPAEGALRNVPDVLLPYQQTWIADTSQVKVCEKSRRIGLSWAEAADAALTAASASGMDVYYMAYNQDMMQQFVKDVAFWAKGFNLTASETASNHRLSNGRPSELPAWRMGGPH